MLHKRTSREHSETECSGTDEAYKLLEDSETFRASCGKHSTCSNPLLPYSRKGV